MTSRKAKRYRTTYRSSQRIAQHGVHPRLPWYAAVFECLLFPNKWYMNPVGRPACSLWGCTNWMWAWNACCVDYIRLMNVIAALLFVSLWCLSRFQSSPLQKQRFGLIIRGCRSSPALLEDFLLQLPPPPPSRLLRLFVVKPCPHGSGSSCSPSP